MAAPSSRGETNTETGSGSAFTVIPRGMAVNRIVCFNATTALPDQANANA